MREIMQEMIDNIVWDVVAVVALACIAVVLTLVSIAIAIAYENAWLLLLLVPAIACFALAVGIYAGGGC